VKHLRDLLYFYLLSLLFCDQFPLIPINVAVDKQDSTLYLYLCNIVMMSQQQYHNIMSSLLKEKYALTLLRAKLEGK